MFFENKPMIKSTKIPGKAKVNSENILLNSKRSDRKYMIKYENTFAKTNAINPTNLQYLFE